MRIVTQMTPRFRRIHIYQSIDNDVGTIFTTLTAPVRIRVNLLWSIFTRAWLSKNQLLLPYLVLSWPVLEEFNESRWFCGWLIIFTRTIHFSPIKTCSPLPYSIGISIANALTNYTSSFQHFRTSKLRPTSSRTHAWTPHFLSIKSVRRKYYSDIFYPKTANLWIRIPKRHLLNRYVNFFKSSVSRYLSDLTT